MEKIKRSYYSTPQLQTYLLKFKNVMIPGHKIRTIIKRFEIAVIQENKKSRMKIHFSKLKEIELAVDIMHSGYYTPSGEILKFKELNK